jgi:hypothetical protein
VSIPANRPSTRIPPKAIGIAESVEAPACEPGGGLCVAEAIGVWDAAGALVTGDAVATGVMVGIGPAVGV